MTLCAHHIMRIIAVQTILFVKKKVQILRRMIKSILNVLGMKEKSTFRVSESANDSILSSLALVRKSLIPVSPQSTFALIIKSFRTRSPTSR